MEVVAIFFTAIIFGGVFGNLLNIVTTRLPADLDLVGPPLTDNGETASPNWYIPYIGARNLQNGRFDWPNFGTQTGAAAVAAIALWLHGFSFAAAQAIILASVLLAILRIDWQHHLIFLLTIWPGIILALIFSGISSWSQLLSHAVAGLAAAAVFLVLFFLAIFLYGKRALGLGDVFLAALIGTMVGLQLVAITILIGMVIAAVGGIFLIAIRVRSRSDYIPYGAYLSLGAMIVVLLVGSTT